MGAGEIRKEKRALFCIDSDGCVMDSMNIKHIRCFGPCLLEEWELEENREALLERWNEINLYSMTRGVNRFKGLAMFLQELQAQGQEIPGLQGLCRWTREAGELSNASLQEALSRETGETAVCLEKALHWSKRVNEAIARLPREEVEPFPGADSVLAELAEMADIAVVSSANAEAVREEWSRFGLLAQVTHVLTQDMGSKAECIRRLLESGYARENTVMVGDAPGDQVAAESNGVLFYPILVGKEAESWRQLLELIRGGAAVDRLCRLQEELKQQFIGNLTREQGGN